MSPRSDWLVLGRRVPAWRVAPWLVGALALAACDSAPLDLTNPISVGGDDGVGPDAGLGGATGSSGGSGGSPGGQNGATAGMPNVAGNGSAGNAGAAGSGGAAIDACSGVQPVTALFSETDAINPPVVSIRPDGVIVTRAAGRIRGRHEKEQTFALYPTNYFEGGTFGLVIEDFTPTGEDRIRVTYLPLATPSNTDLATTNWRAWKQDGDNNTYQFNDYFPLVTELDVPPEAVDAPHAAVLQVEQTAAPQGRAFSKGENFEFEMSIFIDPSAVATPYARTSYYTDCFRYLMGVGGLTPNNTDWVELSGPLPTAQQGGDTTIPWVYQDQEQYFQQVALNVQHENVQHFVQGRRLFYTDFITGEHMGDISISGQAQDPFMDQMNKVGPTFVTTDCGNCHVFGAPSGDVAAMEVKLYGATELGNELQLQEGYPSLAQTASKTVTLGDGSAVTLTQPAIELNLTDDSIVPGFSARVAPKLIGLGLLEAIAEQTVLSRADLADCDNDGISGRPVYVQDAQTGDIRLGRFGWKAEMASIEQEAARALAQDLGVGNSLVPDSAGDIELADDELSDLITYLRLLGVPARRNATDPQVIQGQQLFTMVGCAQCHVADLVTGPNHPFAELRDQAIQPYTDLLLHDMGPDLADDSDVAPVDGVNAASAPPNAQEWRTAPLWGIGLAQIVNANARYLHDGRAATLLEAILWHGGEAQAAVDRFIALPRAEREALEAFVGSL